MDALERSLLEWGVATLTLPGQAESGDRHLVKQFPNGVLVAAADGLGHGEEAGTAAACALSTLEGYAHEPLVALLQRCHERLRHTRGAALSLASFKAAERVMTWEGVGNVEGVLLRAAANPEVRRESLVLRGGVVGSNLPPLHPSAVPVAPGDTLIFATDGIQNGFAEGLDLAEPPQRLADRILAQHATGTDDALVVVARYLG